MRSLGLISYSEFAANEKLKMLEMLRNLNATLEDIKKRTTRENDADLEAEKLKLKITIYLPKKDTATEDGIELQETAPLLLEGSVNNELDLDTLHALIFETENLLRCKNWLRRKWQTESRESIQHIVSSHTALLQERSLYFQTACREDYLSDQYAAVSEAKLRETDRLGSLIVTLKNCQKTISQNKSSFPFSLLKAIIDKAKSLLDSIEANPIYDTRAITKINTENAETLRQLGVKILTAFEKITHLSQNTADRKAKALEKAFRQYASPSIQRNANEFHGLMMDLVSLLREESFLRKDKYHEARNELQTAADEYYHFLKSRSGAYQATHEEHIRSPDFEQEQKDQRATEQKLALLTEKFRILSSWCSRSGVDPATFSRYLNETCAAIEARPLDIDTDFRYPGAAPSPTGSSPQYRGSEPSSPAP